MLKGLRLSWIGGISLGKATQFKNGIYLTVEHEAGKELIVIEPVQVLHNTVII